MNKRRSRDWTGWLEKVHPVTTGCWMWTGHCDTAGYSTTMIAGRATSVHRLSYEQFIGPIPEGLHIDHLCRVPACVNPLHLEPVTPRVNALRGFGMGGRNARKTRCPQGHPLVDGNLAANQLRLGRRECLTCQRQRALAAYYRKRVERVA